MAFEFHIETSTGAVTAQLESAHVVTIPIDTSLTAQGAAAEAKAVGYRFASLDANTINHGSATVGSELTDIFADIGDLQQIASEAVYSVNGNAPDQSGNVEIDVRNAVKVTLNIGASDTSLTVSDIAINADMVVVSCEIDPPTAQDGDWEIETSDGAVYWSGAVTESCTAVIVLSDVVGGE